MAAKKKPRKPQHIKSTKTTANKKTKKKKPAVQKATANKALVKKSAKTSTKKGRAPTKARAAARKVVAAKAAGSPRRPVGASQRVNRVASPPRGRRARSGQQSGDLQGLSTVERADSQSVDELLEEGNAFEADVVTGVEDAGNAEEEEVHVHEVPEDDVPEEYLDKD